MAAKRLAIGKFVFDPSRNSVGLDGKEQTLEPKVADLLLRFSQSPEETLARATLLDDVWGTRIGSDESLTRAVSLLRKVFRADEGATYIETVPKRGYRLIAPVAEAAEEAPATVDAIDQVTASEETLTGDTEQPSTPEQKVPQPWTLGRVVASVSANLFRVVAVLTLAVVLLAGITALEFAEEKKGNKGGVSIASFETSDTPAANFAAQRIEQEMGETLIANGVDFRGDANQAVLVINGLVHSVDDGPLKASFELVNTVTGDVVWSGVLENTSGDAEALADDVLGHIAYSLGCMIRGFDVWDMAARFVPVALRYCGAARRHPGGVEHLEAAEALMDMAADNASVWAVYSMAQAAWHRAAVRDPHAQATTLARGALERAEEMASEKDAGTIRLARIVLAGPDAFTMAEREAELREAVHQDGPSRNWARRLLAQQLLSSGRFVEAEAIIRRIERTDPGDPAVPGLRGLVQSLAGQEDAALLLERAGGQWDEAPKYAHQLFEAHLFGGDVQAASSVWSDERWSFAASGVASGPACTERFLELMAEDRSDRAAALTQACFNSAPISLSRMFAALGHYDEAGAALERVSAFEPVAQKALLFSQTLAPLREDPRFWQALSTTGLIRYYREAERWPDFCSDPRYSETCVLAQSAEM